MYNYTYDTQTGGILLNTSPMQFSKEPRPVYYQELDLLGFNQYWTYEKQDVFPYMWAEANKYYYFGRLAAQLKGGNLYTAPELDIKEELHEPLRPIDIEEMLGKNADFLQTLEQETVKKIYDIWKRRRFKQDIFYVAFSGGKDSVVLLDLVKKALPKDEFVVVFGDTQMEFPDTYDVVDKVEVQCAAEGIRFFRAKSHMDALESWRIFGPPSRVLRWCCSVHKSAPQVLKLREVLGKADYSGLAFVGIRAQESLRRSEYDFESDGMKQRGQQSANPILDWGSYEIWLHIYAHKLIINSTYKKGNARAGCLLCPMSPGKADYLRYVNYQQLIDEYISIIMDTSNRDISKEDCLCNCFWIARKNGISITTDIHYKERSESENLHIEVQEPRTDWKEWIKTLGDFYKIGDTFVVDAKEGQLQFQVNLTKNGYTVDLPLKYIKSSPSLGKFFRQVFRKSAYCLACRTCEVNCKNNCISFENGLKITNCIHCRECHAIPEGCLAFHSLRMPQGDGNMKGLNTFGTHGPKTEWLNDFFERKDDFLSDNQLGPVQKPFFRRFLKDARLIENEKTTDLAVKLSNLGWDGLTSLGILLANLAYNPQFKWYIENIKIGSSYDRKELEDIMLTAGITKRNSSAVLSDFKRIVQTPFGTTLNFGYVDSEGSFTRNKCQIGSPLVILYSLFKFAEACGGYYEFTVARLLNHDIESDGISPAQIFGIEEGELKTILQGLAASYPDFITLKFTHGLDTILLNRDKTAIEVLNLL
ncbi:MAG TPA: phosphoadenosine phosphosulfate reductase family protein [Thermotogota bacterium]|jgi:phosphoadenosine phosphosulfate reductase|nr:phosphoadenosine phosphosulfate reductase family protein [Thermotogota bacterium]NLH20249.1 phosphoadenosine phosphosulfate reductase family protein [Thermotogaceae bacterium]OQC32612.1 MAG: Phosphoadenosine phosphosulfate reductase [Thermotogota bacterium ADurb.Bin062]HNW45964.1 phosphoadenosine phosphosulfate reductase family protein [Thermotogota bacterium]HOD90784.1 phosphoadenosine phosphosulfate reductase family protein [Thermotogota bacterium]